MGKIRIDPLDKLFSEYIRRRAIVTDGGCQRCLSPKYGIVKENGDIFPAWKQLQCAHLQPRRKQSTRYDEDGSAGLCGGCHMFIDSNAEEKIALCIKLIGEERYELLRGRARIIGKPDIELLTLYYKEKLKEIKECH